MLKLSFWEKLAIKIFNSGAKTQIIFISEEIWVIMFQVQKVVNGQINLKYSSLVEKGVSKNTNNIF